MERVNVAACRIFLATRKWQIISVGLLLISVCCCLGCLGFVIWQYIDSQNVAQGGERVCVLCALLAKRVQGSEYESFRSYFDVFVNNEKTEVCCATKVQQLAHLLAMIGIENKSNNTSHVVQNANIENITAVTAHKQLHLPENDTLRQPSSISGNIILAIKAETDSSNEVVQNVEILPTCFRILFPGLYKVYSSIRYEPESNQSCTGINQETWHHNVVRIRPYGSSVLLKSIHSRNSECTMDKETAYTGGVFHLQAGDMLYTEVSGAGLVKFQRDSTYFGIRLLGTVEPRTHE